MSKSVGISQVARNLSKYDGGSDLSLLREMPELTTEQQQYLASAAEDDWRRPLVPVDDGSGLLPNIFSQPINNLAVAQTPQYRLRSVLCAADTADSDATAWQRAFAEAGHRWKRFG